jgi:hypothetical protein
VQGLEYECFGCNTLLVLDMVLVVLVDLNQVEDGLVIVLYIGKDEVCRKVEHYLIQFDEAFLDDQSILMIIGD